MHSLHRLRSVGKLGINSLRRVEAGGLSNKTCSYFFHFQSPKQQCSACSSLHTSGSFAFLSGSPALRLNCNFAHARLRISAREVDQNWIYGVLWSDPKLWNSVKRTHVTSTVYEAPLKNKEVKKVRGIQKDVSPLTTKRIIRKKKTKGSQLQDKVKFS